MLILSTILLCSCRTSVLDKSVVEVPKLEIEVEVERPVLDAIPDLDVSGWTDEQIAEVSDVLAVYNTNMGKLAIYAEELERAMDIEIRYMENVIEILLKGR